MKFCVCGGDASLAEVPLYGLPYFADYNAHSSSATEKKKKKLTPHFKGHLISTYEKNVCRLIFSIGNGLFSRL